MTEKNLEKRTPFAKKVIVKYLPFIITGVVSIVISLTGDWVIRLYLLKETVSHPPAAVAATPIPTQPPPTAAQNRLNQWQEFQSARMQALRDNPELAAEYQELRTEIQQQEGELNAAMLKADPKVAPILAKLELMRHPSPPPGANSNPPTSGALTR